ncbi:MAG: hypothetical protein V4596_00705 [Bdellovibrionota bacterium]
MKKNNTYLGKSLGKVSAVLLILAFVGINFYKTEKEGGPQEQLFAERNKEQIAERKFENQIAPKQNIEKLKFAYTGKWEKNETAQSAQAGGHAFTSPPNTRGNVQAVAAKKATDKKKAKKLAEKKKKKSKVAKKSSKKRSHFDNDSSDSYNDSYVANNYYTQPKPQERTPSEEEEEKKQLTPQELFAQVTQKNSLTPIVEALNKGTATEATYYIVAEMLITAEDSKLNILGFKALALYPSAKNLETYAKHINDTSGEVRTAAEETLKTYKQTVHLSMLNGTLKSSNNELKILSANLIKDITTAILQAQSGEQAAYTEEHLNRFRILLAVSLNVIETALESDLDGSVIASFNTARNTLLQFLG